MGANSALDLLLTGPTWIGARLINGLGQGGKVWGKADEPPGPPWALRRRGRGSEGALPLGSGRTDLHGTASIKRARSTARRWGATWADNKTQLVDSPTSRPCSTLPASTSTTRSVGGAMEIQSASGSTSPGSRYRAALVRHVRPERQGLQGVRPLLRRQLRPGLRLVLVGRGRVQAARGLLRGLAKEGLLRRGHRPLWRARRTPTWRRRATWTRRRREVARRSRPRRARRRARTRSRRRRKLRRRAMNA